MGNQKIIGKIVGIGCDGSCGSVEYHDPRSGAYRVAVVDHDTVGRKKLIKRLGGKLKVGERVTIAKKESVPGKRHVTRIS